MYQVASEAVARARAGEGPTLIEAKTHRKGGHAEGEEAFLAGQEYRTEEESEAARRNDPLLRLHDYILAEQLIVGEVLETLDQEIVQAVEEAVAFARASQDPDATVLFDDLWVEAR